MCNFVMDGIFDILAYAEKIPRFAVLNHLYFYYRMDFRLPQGNAGNRNLSLEPD